MDYSALSASDGSGESVRATVQSPGRIIGSTAIPVNALTNWPAGKFIATTGTLRADKTLDPATVQVFYGTASGTTITITGFAPGYTDKGNEIGDVAVIKPSTEWADTVAGFIADTTGHGTPVALTAASINDSNNNKIINLVPTASAVNEVTVQNSATGSGPLIYPAGSDPNIDLTLSSKGTGHVKLLTSLYNPYKFRATSSANGAWASGAWTTISFNSESYDTSNNFSTDTFTAPINGFYQLNLSTGTTNAAGNLQGIGLRFLKNGSVDLTLSPFSFDNNVSYDSMNFAISDCVSLSAGDTIKAQGLLFIIGGNVSVAGTVFSGYLVSAA